MLQLPTCGCTYVLQEAPIDGHAKYDDGWYGGKRLFESQINRGMFLPLKGLHPDWRFASDDSQELPNRKFFRTENVLYVHESTLS